ncbi:MAG: alpha-galactosidase [Verrucomicrobia bacterium]|nr:alpha-galactosidase [Verrucomicrobiota bacterium]MCH8511900.1 alpha-galactosidase [Kiritimatiellia bacterium]
MNVHLEIDPTSPFTPTLTWREPEPGLRLGILKLEAPQPEVAPGVKIAFTHPVGDIQGLWTPTGGMDKGLRWDWGSPIRTGPTSGTPVACLYNPAGLNRLTFASGITDLSVELNAGVHEESACINCWVQINEGAAAKKVHEFELRVDTRPLPWFEVLSGVSAWWETQPGGQPMPVPPVAFEPMYSTWYAYHQNLDTDILLAQCRLAADLGCRAIIVDDGWQTLDNQRGYAFCGDWQPDRMPNMREWVDQVHALGMKVLLWYSVPYVGDHSAAKAKFEGKFLAYDARKGAWTLDPRFPDVRAYLLGLYLQAVQEWDLDGFKLDFVDAFPLTSRLPETHVDQMDHPSVGAALLTLLREVREGLEVVRPDILIEFRQSYVGPAMRGFGNLFRAGDCPRDYRRNRIAVTDLRVMAGSTAVHADMIMWHPEETVESAALQFINVLFAVLQYSMRIEELSPAHMELSRFWIGFMRKHRQVLLQGHFRPHQPESGYPLLEAWTEDSRVMVVHEAGKLCPVADLRNETWVVNGSPEPECFLFLPEDCHCECLNGLGQTVGTRALKAGLVRVPIPSAGLGRLFV